MNTSATGIVALKVREDCRLSAYWDNATPPVATIGWGTTHYPNGHPVQIGDTCTQADADEWLILVVTRIERWVDPVTSHLLLRQRQFDALVSFAYNVGTNALEHSTLLRLVKANPENPGIRGEFMRWVHAGGSLNHGLWNRRHSEADQYLGVHTPVPPFPDLPRAA